MKRIMIAAPKSGSGKTMITCALLQAFLDDGEQMVSYKCGPDYIDPMFHQTVLGIPSKNLDTFFSGEEETKKLFLKNRKENDFAVIEGVMGLFDGLGGIRKEGSSYHLAQVTRTPVILTVDAKGMGRSLISLIAGFLQYDTQKLIKGVILNRMSKPYYEMLKPVIEEELHISVLGYFPEDKTLHIESRHLGLMMPGEIEDIREQLKALSGKLRQTVSLEKIRELAEDAEDLPHALQDMSADRADTAPKPVIAVAKDEAFCFYYEDNLRMLEEYGADIVCFSPLSDTELPKGCCGLLLGGGYPELYAGRLSSNTAMHQAVRKAMETGMPVVAECGGFMYLHAKIQDKDAKAYPMVGVLPATCYDTGRTVRFGYVELEDKKGSFLPVGQKIRAHEFHYFDSEENGKDCIATKPVTGKRYACAFVNDNCFLGFPHLYYPSNPVFAENFVKKARAYQRKKEA